MYLLLIIAVWISFAYKFVDWSQWKKQYSSILFLMVIKLLYNMIYYNILYRLFEELQLIGLITRLLTWLLPSLFARSD